MKVSTVLFYMALGATSARALPTEAVDVQGGLEARDNLPGLNALQSKYARGIIAQAKKDGVGAHGCQAGIATALTEVRPLPCQPGLRMRWLRSVLLLIALCGI